MMGRFLLLPLFAAFILVFSASAYPLFAADSGRRMGVEMKLLGAGSDFIIANEKKFMVTPKTKILDKNSQDISLNRLPKGAKVYIEYTAGANKAPVAVFIKVVSSPQ